MRIRTALAAGLIATGATLAATPAWATPGNGDNVTLCHRTDSDSNPYVQITVDPDSVFKQGHDGHDGPVWNPSLKPSHTKWGDIIPPFDYTAKHGHSSTQAHYDGKNWTSDGRAIYDNGCAPASPPPSSPPATHSPSESPTPSHSSTPSSTPSHSSTPTAPPSTPPSTPPGTPTHSPTTPPSTPPTMSPSTPPTVPPTHSPPVPSHSPTPPIVCAGCPLPHTGFPVWPLAAVGGAMVLAGAGLLRRRF